MSLLMSLFDPAPMSGIRQLEHTRLVVAKEMENAQAFKKPPRRKERGRRPGSTYGKGKELILALIQSRTTTTSNQILRSLSMNDDAVRRLLRDLKDEGKIICVQAVNNGARTPAVWKAAEVRDGE